ncbi:MAG: isoprenylcysteine carboxylmethyltransferase family protein [Candidatus Pacebacteria bacterium]|nr:isoprenylcysteine carboxylmethyltransferase family protein [Candidatus Paceibacterota bacterium]MBP9716135.1 isoprenylcysteine carboxylmethyltransferase family protein [Candidatus Paceibacterota bacterium]
MTPEEKNEKLKNDPGSVHFTLIYSYMTYFVPVILGMILDYILPNYSFNNSTLHAVGFWIIIVSSLLIYWAQSTTGKSKKKMFEKGEQREFARGPYKYNRNPTYVGLVAMTFGLGLVMGSIFVTALVVVSALFSKFVFLPREEKILELKYGQIYRDYKKKVKNWL